MDGTLKHIVYRGFIEMQQAIQNCSNAQRNWFRIATNNWEMVACHLQHDELKKN